MSKTMTLDLRYQGWWVNKDPETLLNLKKQGNKDLTNLSFDLSQRSFFKAQLTKKSVNQIITSKDSIKTSRTSDTLSDKQIDQSRVTYTGKLKDGKRHGKGILVIKDKLIYNGEFKAGEFHGPGVLTYEDGRLIEGTWVAGLINGKGKEIWKDGSIYEGEFLNGLKQGYGVYTWADKTTFSGYWQDDKAHGEVN